MTKANITLFAERDRRLVIDMILVAPLKSRITIAEGKRSDEQNRKLWSMIGDVMRDQPGWFGPGLDKDDVKQIFMAALFRELRMARNADGDGYVPLTRRSSAMSVREMANLLELIAAWGADPAHPVTFRDPRDYDDDGASSSRHGQPRRINDTPTPSLPVKPVTEGVGA